MNEKRLKEIKANVNKRAMITAAMGYPIDAAVAEALELLNYIDFLHTKNKQLKDENKELRKK